MLMCVHCSVLTSISQNVYLHIHKFDVPYSMLDHVKLLCSIECAIEQQCVHQQAENLVLRPFLMGWLARKQRTRLCLTSI